LKLILVPIFLPFAFSHPFSTFVQSYEISTANLFPPGLRVIAVAVNSLQQDCPSIFLPPFVRAGNGMQMQFW
jgi:hypothetical protein